MPIAHVRGVALNYEILGDSGPFVALQPGGRRAGSALRSLASKIAEAGNRVVIYDRRNTGASTIAIDGESENQEWADDLHELLREIDARPAFVGGSSSGCRLALLLALQHKRGGARPVAVAGDRRRARGRASDEPVLHLAYRGGAAGRHGGGLQARSLERGDRDQPAGARCADGARSARTFIGRMNRWRQGFQAGSEHPVIGLSPAELRSMTMPACIVPGMDPVHPTAGRSGGAPSDAECRIRRGRHRNAGDARRGFRRLGGARGAARGPVHRLCAPARKTINCGGAVRAG